MRALTSQTTGQSTAGLNFPIILASIGLASTTKYVWSGVGTISWNGQSWLGLGDLGTISSISESGELQAQGIQLGLSAIANDLLADSLTEIRVGRPVRIYLGFLDPITAAIVPDPYLLYKGMVDEPKTKIGPSESSVTLKLENRLIDMQRNSSLRLDSETQRRLYPGDAGMDFCSQLADAVWAWK